MDPYAMSGLSCPYPDPGKTCRKADVWTIALDLTRQSLLSGTLPNNEPLSIASRSGGSGAVSMAAAAGRELPAAVPEFGLIVVAYEPDAHFHIHCIQPLTNLRGPLRSAN
jgi:hypothetical protein